MNEEDIKEIVRQVITDSLQIRVYDLSAFDGRKMCVELQLGNEVISKDFEYIDK